MTNRKRDRRSADLSELPGWAEFRFAPDQRAALKEAGLADRTIRALEIQVYNALCDDGDYMSTTAVEVAREAGALAPLLRGASRAIGKIGERTADEMELKARAPELSRLRRDLSKFARAAESVGKMRANRSREGELKRHLGFTVAQVLEAHGHSISGGRNALFVRAIGLAFNAIALRGDARNTARAVLGEMGKTPINK